MYESLILNFGLVVWLLCWVGEVVVFLVGYIVINK